MPDDIISTPLGQAAIFVASFAALAVIWLYLVNSADFWLKRGLGYIHVEGLEEVLDRTVKLLRVWGLFACLSLGLQLGRVLPEEISLVGMKVLLGLLILLLGAAIAESLWRIVGHQLGTAGTPQPLVRFAQVTVLSSFSYLTLLLLVAELDISITPLIGVGVLGAIPLLLLLQDYAADLFFYFRLMRRQHLRAGDFVRLESGVAGHVVSVSWQDVRIRTRANNLVVIPNRRLARLIVTNFHLPEKRGSLTVSIPVTGASSQDVVESILKDELQLAAQDLPGLASDVTCEIRLASEKPREGYAFLVVCQVEDMDLAEKLEHEILKRIALRFRKEEVESPLLDLLAEGTSTASPTKSSQDLQFLVKGKFADTLFVVASHAEPYVHSFDGPSIRWTKPASGLVTALDPVMQVLGGIWIGASRGNADREVSDSEGRLQVPPDTPTYALKRLWLDRELESKFYNGFANGALWPLCHTVYVRPVFNADEWRAYREVNRLVAEAILEEIGHNKAFIFLQDYHLALVPRLLKEAGANATIAHFWHIPWPTSQVFQTCPWAEEILDGLLGNDLLGFHTRYLCNNFLETVDRTVESRVDYGGYSVTRNNRQTLVRPYPISVDYEAISQGVGGVAVQRQRAQLQREMGITGGLIGLGVDRLDYTKGIPERLKSIDHLFNMQPEHKQRFTFIQVGVPSRSQIKAYQDLDDEIQHLVDEINWRHRVDSWQPIIYFRRHFPTTPLWALYSMANVCIVSSLHDGMNLVAKEYVASRAQGDGVLVLSRFTGAATELRDALLVNPYDTEQLSEAIAQALAMPLPEQRQRMGRMRAYLQENDIYRWAIRVLGELSRLETPLGEFARPSDR